MSGTTTKDTTGSPTPPADGIRDALRGKYVCPFCGSVNDSEQGMCPRCTMENSAATRKATKTRIGPWYVLQTRNPAAPGMTWDTLVSFVRKGRVKPRSIVRGPTTHQLWRFAAHVKGLSREFGICYSCGTGVDTTTSICPTCNRLQDPPPNPDALLEQSREGQTAPGAAVHPDGTPPATVMGTVTLAGAGVPPGSAPAFGAVPPGLAASFGSAPPFGAAEPSVPPPPPPDEAEFVIPAFGENAAPPATTAAPPTQAFTAPLPAAPTQAFTASPTRQSTVPATANGAASPTPDYSGLSGDASWAKIGQRERTAASRNPFRPPAGTPAPAVAPPNNFNPYAADDDNAAAGRPTEGFLSAKDLAAAFNLGFVGENEEDDAAKPQPRNGKAPARSDAAAMAAAGLTPGFPVGSAFPAGPRPPRPWAKIILVLLLLAGASAGVALAVSPDLRQIVKRWGRDLTQKMGIETGEADTPARPKRPATQPATAPAATRPADDSDAPSTRPTSDNPTAVDLAAASADAFKLYQEALTLERTKPEEALAKLDQVVKQFPRQAWPADLEAAKARVTGKVNRLRGNGG